MVVAIRKMTRIASHYSKPVLINLPTLAGWLVSEGIRDIF
jgi:hypothetical protein